MRTLVFYKNSSLERRASKTEKQWKQIKFRILENFEKWSCIRLSRIHLQVIDTIQGLRKSSVTSTRTANEKKWKKNSWKRCATNRSYLTKLVLKYSLKQELKSHPNDSKVWMDQSNYVWGYCCGCQSIKVSTFEALKTWRYVPNLNQGWSESFWLRPLVIFKWGYTTSNYLF